MPAPETRLAATRARCCASAPARAARGSSRGRRLRVPRPACRRGPGRLRQLDVRAARPPSSTAGSGRHPRQTEASRRCRPVLDAVGPGRRDRRRGRAATDSVPPVPRCGSTRRSTAPRRPAFDRRWRHRSTPRASGARLARRGRAGPSDSYRGRQRRRGGRPARRDAGPADRLPREHRCRCPPGACLRRADGGHRRALGRSLQWDGDERRPLLVPSWLFDRRGVDCSRSCIVAVDPAYLADPLPTDPAAASGSAALPGSPGTADPGTPVEPVAPPSTVGLDLRFDWRGPGRRRRGACGCRFYGGVTAATPTTSGHRVGRPGVAAAGRAERRARSASTGAEQYERTVPLDAPLGNRPVVDADTGERCSSAKAPAAARRPDATRRAPVGCRHRAS